MSTETLVQSGSVANSPPDIADLPQLLAASLTTESPRAAYARTVLALEDFFSSAARLDEDTGASLARACSELREKCAAHLKAGPLGVAHDGLFRAVLLAETALRKILHHPRSRLQRRHVMLQMQKIKAQDMRSIQWLSRQPGKTVRQKAGAARRVMAVTREGTPQVAENRVVVRVAHELGALLNTSLQSQGDSGHASKDGRLKRLGRAQQLCRQCVAELAVEGVRPSLLPRPNNVLLSDPNYSRVWRVWQWLVRRRDVFEQSWRAAPQTLRAAVEAAFAAVLSAQPNCRMTEGFGRIRLESGHAHDLIEAAEAPQMAQGVESLAGGNWRAISFNPNGRLQVASLGPTASGFALELTPLSGTGVLKAGAPKRAEIDVCLNLAGKCERARGAPFRLQWTENGSSVHLNLHADAMGLLEAGEWLLKRFGTISQVPVSTSALRKDWQYAGWDLSGAWLRASTNSEPAGQAVMPLRADFWDLGDAGQFWRAGGALAPNGCGAGAARRLALPAEWSRLHEKESAGLLPHLLEALNAPMDAEVALAISDGLDERALSAVWRALPSTHARTCTIWRSAAAALGWRADKSQNTPEFNVGDGLLVVDMESTSLSVVLLIGREHATSKDGRALGDTWYWERQLPLPVLPENATTTWRAAQIEWARSEIEALIRKGLGGRELLEGEIAALENLAAEAVDHGELRWNNACVRLALPTELASAGAWLEWIPKPPPPELMEGRLQRWLGAFIAAKHPQQVRTLMKNHGSRLHVLAIGEPFARDELKRWTREKLGPALGASVQASTSPEYAAARGARVFIERRNAGLLTYSDRLPDLFLEVNAVGGTRKLPIFKSELVRPGETITNDTEEFSIPPRRDIVLPLYRDTQSLNPLAFSAFVRRDRLNLNATTRVYLRIQFRYAEDDFQIVLHPGKGNGAQFNEVPVELGRPQTENRPPDFPLETPWQDGELEPLAGRAESLYRAVASLTTDGDTERRSAAGKPDKKKKLDERFASLLAILDDLKPRIRSAWSGRKPRDLPLAANQVLAEKLLPALCGLTGMPSSGRPLKVNKQFWTDPASADKMYQVDQAAFALLCRMRGLSPRGMAAECLMRLAKKPEQRHFENLGRLLEDGRNADAQRSAEFLIQELERTLRKHALIELRHPLWALATALWSHPNFVKALSEGQCTRLLGDLEALLQLLEKSWNEQKNAIELCNESGMVLLGMMCLRGGPLDGLVTAGCAGLSGVSDLLARLAGKEPGKRDRKPRLRLVAKEVAEELPAQALFARFADDVEACLRGARIARISALEEE